MSSSSGYVAIPRCPVIFDGANYPDFAAFMRIHMHGIRLWGVLSDEVSCPPCPTSPLAPIPPTPPVLSDGATQMLRVLIGVLLLPMMCSFSSTLVPLRPIGWI
jgi:hypothetical protein